jgi:hypothetical protein
VTSIVHQSRLLPRGFRPRSASGWADGIANATRGRPQYPWLLDRYGPNRPPWNVAGVDYRVGLPEGKALKDWRTLTDPALSVNTSNGLILIQSDCVIDGIDFSLGIAGRIANQIGGAANVTIRNCYFGAQPGQNVINNLIQEANQATLYIHHNTFDGTNMNGMNQFVTIQHGGVVTVEYNWMSNSQAQFVAALVDGTCALKYRFNLLDNCNTHSDGAHMNWLQCDAGASHNFNLDVSYNTGYKHSLSGAEGFQPDATVMPAPNVSNNTMMALPDFTGIGAPLAATAVTFSSPTFSGVQLPNGKAVILRGTVPTGGNFVAATTYWVVNSSGTTFQLAAYFGGVPLTGTSAGSGLTVENAVDNLGPQTMSNILHGFNASTPGTNANNCFDLTGAYFAYYGGTMTPAQNWVSTNNRDLMSGKLIVPT